MGTGEGEESWEKEEEVVQEETDIGGFLSGLVVRTQRFHCRGMGSPWLGNHILSMVHNIAKNKRREKRSESGIGPREGRKEALRTEGDGDSGREGEHKDSR